MTCGVTVESDFPRPHWLLGCDRLAEKCLRGFDSSILSQQWIDGLAVFIDSTIEICRFAANADGSLIHAPRGIHPSRVPGPPSFVFRYVAQHPAHDRRMRHDDAALGHHGSQVSVAQSVGYVPADAELNGFGLEPATSIDRVAFDWLSHSCSP